MKQCDTMILPFSTNLNGKPTYFVEKIHSGLVQNNLMRIFDMDLAHEDFDISVLAECHPKLHSIREDKNDRWKVGNKIHFFINCRQPNMFRFAPVLPVVSVQEIKIVFITDFPYCINAPEIQIDGKCLPEAKYLELAQNDGFDTIEAFFEYFNGDFQGKIIHWTNKKY
jgi:hypothetical protein